MSTKPDTALQAIYREHNAVNDVMLAFEILRKLTCSVCGATASTTERQGMAAAREMYDQGWTAIDKSTPGRNIAVAVCPDCGLL